MENQNNQQLLNPNDFETISHMKVEDYLNYQLKLQIDDVMNHMEKKVEELKESSNKKKEEIRQRLESNNENSAQE